MSLRNYSVGGKKATFNKIAFQQFIKSKQRNDGISISILEKIIAEKLSISDSTVHKWIYNGGGPIDYDMVKQLAEVLGINDVSDLLIFTEEGGKRLMHFSDRQMAAIKRIYDICVWFMYEFERTDGFFTYVTEFSMAGYANPQDEKMLRADEMYSKVQLVLDQEYFDLHDCEIYSELCEFVSEDLLNMYDGKFDSGCLGVIRESYDKAMIRLNTIIDTCR